MHLAYYLGSTLFGAFTPNPPESPTKTNSGQCQQLCSSSPAGQNKWHFYHESSLKVNNSVINTWSCRNLPWKATGLEKSIHL